MRLSASKYKRHSQLNQQDSLAQLDQLVQLEPLDLLASRDYPVTLDNKDSLAQPVRRELWVLQVRLDHRVCLAQLDRLGKKDSLVIRESKA